MQNDPYSNSFVNLFCYIFTLQMQITDCDLYMVRAYIYWTGLNVPIFHCAHNVQLKVHKKNDLQV